MENKNFYIELNGVANLKALLDVPLECPVMQRKALMDQLDYLERYMLALAEAAQKGEAPPAWHDVRDNRERYPTAREKNNGRT